MADQKVAWGVISSAKIARNALIPAITAASNARLVCVGTGNPERVRENVEEYGYRVAPSYDAVLEDPEVQVVYNPLPNGMHASWSIKAMQAGKHVLCEKPFSVTPAETEEMIDVAEQTGRLLMEAFMYRFHPQIQAAKDLLDSGRIGTLRYIRSSFSFNGTPDPTNPRFQAGQGPGALMDVGCYCVNATRFFAGGAPKAVSAWSTWHAESGGDLSTVGVLEYEHCAGLIDCSFEATFRSGIELVGSDGRIEIPKPWLPGTDPAVVRVWDQNSEETLTLDGVNHYQLMVEHFSDCVLTGNRPVRGPQDALENMRVLEALRRSAQEQRRVLLSEI